MSVWTYHCVKVAHQAGYICEHVNFLGLSAQKDWELMRKVQAGEYTFVTLQQSVPKKTAARGTGYHHSQCASLSAAPHSPKLRYRISRAEI